MALHSLHAALHGATLPSCIHSTAAAAMTVTVLALTATHLLSAQGAANRLSSSASGRWYPVVMYAIADSGMTSMLRLRATASVPYSSWRAAGGEGSRPGVITPVRAGGTGVRGRCTRGSVQAGTVTVTGRLRHHTGRVTPPLLPAHSQAAALPRTSMYPALRPISWLIFRMARRDRRSRGAKQLRRWAAGTLFSLPARRSHLSHSGCCCCDQLQVHSTSCGCAAVLARHSAKCPLHRTSPCRQGKEWNQQG